MPLSDEDMYKIMGPTSMSPEELGYIKETAAPKKSIYSWDLYHSLVTKLSEKIDFKPEVVISIGKGGSIPGVILAEHYNIDNYNFGIKSYTGFNQSKMIEYQSIPSYESFRGSKILLVDDLADSGNTFAYALQKFKQNLVNDVKTASVFKKTKSKFIPDYYAEEVHSEVWIVQPWEKD